MQKNFTQLIAHYLSAKRYTVPAGTLLFFIITAIYIQAAVGISITGAASYSLSADLAVTTTFTPITDVVVTEGATTDFASSNSYRIVFTAPTGWVFPGSGVSASRNGTGEVTLTTTPVYTADASGAGARTIEFTLKAGNGAQNKTDIITISGLSIKSTNGVIDPTQPKFVSVQVLNTTNTTPTTVATATPISLSQTPGAPNKLAFVQQPTTVETNTAITPSPSVAIQDRFGNTVSAATNAVTLARTPDTSLSGVLTPGTGSISNGVVTFTGASVNTAGVGYTLVASSSGLTSATSTAFTVNNLRPVITDVVECVTVGDPETTVTVTGSNFVSGATVTFDGVTRAATFVNSTTLTTVLTTADLSSVRDVNVTVNNPLPASNNGVSLPISERVRALFSFPIEGPNAVCANTPNSTAFTTQTGPNVSSYLWAVVSGDATIASGGTTGNPLINFGNAGEVTLSVIAYNFCGKPGPATIRTITVKPRPDVVLDASKTEICQGESVRLSASGADSYQWYGGGLNGTTETEVTVSPTSTLTYTLVGTTDGCSATKTVTINVTPALSQGAITGSTQLCQNQAVDAASALTATVSGGVTAKTYLWEQSPTSLEGSWSSVATTATYAPSTATAGTVYYRRTVNSGSCSVTSDPVAVTVTPAIVGNTIATADQNVCSGDDIALLDGAAATAGSQQVAYFWEQRAAGTSTWANADGTYTNEDYQPATRTVTSASAIEYRRRVEAGNCVSFTDVVSVTVNPRPEATITQGQFTYFCSPGTALLSATEVAGASYTWFRAEANGPVEVANTRTTEVGVVGTYYVVVKYNATTCESTSATISVQETVVGNNIIGTENGDQVVCYNTIPAEIVGSTATSTVGPVTYQWLVSTDNTTFTALTGATGINLSRAQLGAHTADRWYRRMAIVGSCTNTSPETVHISVRPEVLLTSTATPAPICSGETFSYTPATNAAGTSTFAWSRADVAGISNPAATGSGAIAEQLVNTTAMPLEVTYIYRITTENGCESALQYVKVEVNPRPVLNNATTQVAVCSNAPFTYTATTATTSLPAPSFAWTRAAVDGISNVAASGTGATVSETLVNTTTAPVNVTYVYTITANGCAGEPQEVVVTVNPRPVLSSTLAPPAICSGATFGYTPTSATAGATFSWERLAATNITSNGGTTGTGAVNQTLTNSGTAPVEVTYRYTVSANGCAGASTEDVKVTVNPTPQLSSTLTASVCSGSAFSYTPTSATEGATFSWTRAAVTGISNAAVTTPVAGGVSETLVNTTTAPINVTYVYTTSANGCPGTPQNLVVRVNPQPTATFSGVTNGQVIYSGAGNITLVPTGTTGGTFSGPGVSGTTFNPCTALGTATEVNVIIRYTVTLGTAPNTCTAVEEKTVTIKKSTYKAVVTSSFKPFCRGDNVTHTAKVWRDAEVIYPYLTNAAGDPVRDLETMTPIGPQELPVANPNYEFPAGTPEGIKLVAWRYFNPIVRNGVEVPIPAGNIQWTKNQEVNIGADDEDFKNAGLSSLDYYAAYVTVDGGACGPQFNKRISSRTYTAEQANYSITLSAAPQPVCQGEEVTLTATLNSAFPYWSEIGLNLEWIVTRDGTSYTLGNTTYTDENNTSGLQLITTGPEGGFIDGDEVSIVFTSDLDSRDRADSKCAGGEISTVVILDVNDIATVTPTLKNPIVCVGSSETFTAPVTTTGTSEVTYIWTVGVAPDIRTIETTTESLTIVADGTFTPDVAYPVSVVVTNTTCETTGSIALGSITVNTPPAITARPSALTVCEGDASASFSVTATGSGLTYQWYKNGVEIAGATESSYTITSPNEANEAMYSVIVSGTSACGVLDPVEAMLTVNQPVVATPGTAGTYCQKDNITLSVEAEGTGVDGGDLVYEWFKDNVSIGNNSSTLTLSNAQPEQSGVYTVEVTGACNQETVSLGTLTVNPLLTVDGKITSAPDPVMIDEAATFTVETDIATGVEVLYQWYTGDEESESWTLAATNRVVSSENSFTITKVVPGEFDVKVEVTPLNTGTNCYNPAVFINGEIVPLPVEILYLNASKQGNDVLLEWATASEQDNKGFEVQVSKDGLNYRLLTFVPSKNGNSNTKQVYAFTDKESGKDGTRYYRLKQIDHAGTFEFFGPKVVTFGAVASKVIAFPNPFNDEITLDIASETDGEMLIMVTDAVGKQLLQRKVQVENGFTTEKLKLDAGLPRGLYIIKTQIGGYTQFIKMIKE
ncbi:PKD-like domain-containing protein [Pontibacter toksunensis]|uniref:PKD-like domain-containing protein n=1 Tax=Pontibacter toksunensis TaxID=1332631 RepID=A0ABW6C1Z4_9BACT